MSVQVPVTIDRKSTANWEVVGFLSVNPDNPWATRAVFLIDRDSSNRSVTNDAENVVADLFKAYGNLRFIYRDSDGNWDELTHDNGRFLGFMIMARKEWGSLLDQSLMGVSR